MLQTSVPFPSGSKFTTSGATNSGVPNIIFRGVFGVYLLAKPKSIILIRSRRSGLRQRIFSGCKNNRFSNHRTLKYFFVDGKRFWRSYFKIKMKNVDRVHVRKRLTNLTQINDRKLLCELERVISNSLKKFTSCDAEIQPITIYQFTSNAT